MTSSHSFASSLISRRDKLWYWFGR
jgi:hypothetical protein